MEDGGAVEVFDEAGADDVGLDAGSAEEAGADVDGAQAASSSERASTAVRFSGSIISFLSFRGMAAITLFLYLVAKNSIFSACQENISSLSAV